VTTQKRRISTKGSIKKKSLSVAKKKKAATTKKISSKKKSGGRKNFGQPMIIGDNSDETIETNSTGPRKSSTPKDEII
jgi:hypothetical protein